MLFIVNGITSPLGQFLAETLVSNNKCTVIGIARRKIRLLKDIKLIYENEIELADFTELQFEKRCLINVASLVPAKSTSELNFHYENGLLIPNLIQKIVSHFHISHLANISTSDVYNHNLSFAKESEIELPSNHYGMSKLLLEARVKDIGKVYNIPTANLRVPVLMVPGVKNNFIANWLELARKGQSLYYSNPEGKFNNLGDGRTILEAICQFVELQYESCDINIGSSDVTSIFELLEIFQKAIFPTKVHFIEKEASKQPQLLDLSGIKKLNVLGHSVSETLNWFMKGKSNG